MEFGVLGPLEVRSPGGPVAVRRGQPRTALIALLLRAGHTVSSDVLIDVLWGDDAPRNPANALHVQISYLRKALGSAEPGAGSMLETRAGGYALLVAPDDIDATKFEANVRRFRPVDELRTHEQAVAALGEADTALGLWRGEALEDVASFEFARGEATRLSEIRWTAIERRMDLLLLVGRHGEAVGDLVDLVRRVPFHERFHEQLVVALYRCGRQGDALRAYEDARTVLVDELGIDPGSELRQLEQAVLHQDPKLDWTPLPSDAAPPVAPAVTGAPMAQAAVGRVPLPLSALVGREHQVARLRELLLRHRAVTLTGPGGAGKTRLAIELASQDQRRVWYVDLGPIDDPALVAPTVAALIGATVGPDDDATRVVADTLANQEVMLVLDTCEHVVAAAAQLTSTVLHAAAGVQVLATSRRPLGISGEFAWPVPPLDLPSSDATAARDITEHAAVALFIERAHAVRPELEVDDDCAADIAAICQALDGLPLAIELAAARVDVLSPAAIRARLEDRFELLTDGGVDVAQRQQTLRGTLDWSFELLSPDQRTFFARLGAFAGTFDLDAALAVAGAGLPPALELLSSLVKQSMVTRAGQDRYRLLDTLRAYAVDVLADLDADATRDRHAAYYAEWAERGADEIRGPNQFVWLEYLRADINNFRAALEWSLLTGDLEPAARLAGALSWFWTLNGMLTEAIQHLERLVDVDSVPASVRAKCLWGHALVSASLGRLETARDAGYAAAELGRSHDDLAGTAYGLNAAAVAEWALGNHERSFDAHTEAVVLLEKVDDWWGLAVCKVLQARTLFDQTDPAAASVAREGEADARRSGDRHVLGLALTQIAHIALGDGDHDAAIAAAAEGLGLQEAIGYTEGAISALHVLGQAHRSAGHVAEARTLHRQALGLAARIGHVAAMCEAMEDLARTEADDDPTLAGLLIRAAASERDARGIPLRPRDAIDLDSLQASLTPATGVDPPERPFMSLVAELAQ